MPGDGCRPLAKARRLGVEPAFAGDHEVSAPDPVVEAQRFHYHLGAWAQPRSRERHQPGPKTARRAGTGQPLNILAEVSPNDLGEVLEGRVELRHYLRGGPLLGPIDGTRAAGPGQRVGDITRDVDLGALPVAMHATNVDAGQLL